jgi:hypothetical protein
MVMRGGTTSPEIAEKRIRARIGIDSHESDSVQQWGANQVAHLLRTGASEIGCRFVLKKLD